MEKEEKIKILADLIKIQTVNGNEIEVAKYLKTILADHQINATIDSFGDKRANLEAEIGDKDPLNKILAFSGHQDTVTIDDEKIWIFDPFSAQIEGDKIYGRGASDMKSGLAAEAIALIELNENPHVNLNGTLRFIATAGEEYGTPGAYRLNDQHAIDDVDALVIGEPTNGQIIYAHSGSFNYRITSTGQAAHSSTPTRGINAIQGLVNYINLEEGLFDDVPEGPYLGAVQHSITVIHGGNQVNTIPAQAELRGNIRPTQAFDNNHVISKIEEALRKLNQQHDAQLKLEIIHNFEPVETPSDNKFVQLVQRSAQKSFSEREVKLKTMNGATDASVFVKNNYGLPTVILGADGIETNHQPNEYTTISSYLALIKAYQEIAIKFLK
ncbi:ArgE/DapE family deacylase [Ligilactobacillus acidipiscis]|uniref:ArgE/DapE family deacylase n=1 Tax=Ligilactobacillus acidipiscis TaxID=89059 RepID=UPI0023FA3B80|nr:ArgE/DapE family deacylase [Ligilactobacillus acidipiscis]WEV58212.1 ArgE/DapE family deacylase [Ligilactobacillus acidipiscis]